MSLLQPRPLKSGDPSARNWRRINDAIARAADARNQASQLRYRDSRGPSLAADALHPFKIYQPPWNLCDPIDWSTFWRTFRIRAGRVLESNATETDAADADPDAPSYPSGDLDLIVPEECAQFWFWLEIDTSGAATTAVVRWGDDPTASNYPASGTPDWTSTDPWDSFTVPDANHIPIGWVDTDTDKANLRATVRQLLRTDVVQVGSGSGATRMRVKSVQGDYLTCRTLNDEDEEGETDVFVAKPPALRHSITSQTINGAEISFESYGISAGVCTRLAVSGILTQDEMVLPVYQLGSGPDSEIFATKPSGGTDVIKDEGLETEEVLVWLDLNVDGRAWCQIP